MESETPDQIIEATYRALCRHGYADLTMQRIADESDMTTAAIHYHFDTKQELMDAFLQHIIERFAQRLASDASDPRDRLATLLDAIFVPAEDRDEDFPVALMELKAQAPFQETFRTRFEDLDRTTRTVVADAVRDGIDAGYFKDADPATVARFVVTAIDGSHARTVTLGEAPHKTRGMIETYLDLQLGWTPEVDA